MRVSNKNDERKKYFAMLVIQHFRDCVGRMTYASRGRCFIQKNASRSNGM